MGLGRVLRSVWHVLPVAPTLYVYHHGQASPVISLLVMTTAWSLGEAYRLTHPTVNARLLAFAGSGLRSAEARWPTGTFFYLWGVTCTLCCFSLDAAVAGLLCLQFADPAAAVVGGALGRWRGPSLRSGKSVGGFVTAWIVASLVVLCHAAHLRNGREGNLWAAPPIGLCAALAESFGPIDDNFALPLASAACASAFLLR